MRAKRVLEVIIDWAQDPGGGGIIYQCRSCGTAYDTPQAECPDCGEDVDELPVEASPPYVGPLG